MAMTLRLTEVETHALRRRAQAEHTTMQELARRAIRTYVEDSERAEALRSIIDTEVPRYAEALRRLGE